MEEIRLVGEHWQDNLIGLRWNDRLQAAVNQKHLNEVRLAKAELDLTQLKKGKLLEQNMIDSAVIAVLKSTSDPKILDVGFSVPEDMFMNNFGLWFATILQPGNLSYATYPIQGYSMTDITNTARAITSQYYQGGSPTQCYNNSNTGAGTQFQVGSSTAAAARTQYQIQTPFGTAPESGRFSSGAGSYAAGSGVVSCAGAIAAGGSGTINEVALFGLWGIIANNWYTFMLTREVLGAGVAFVAGNPIVATLTINI